MAAMIPTLRFKICSPFSQITTRLEGRALMSNTRVVRYSFHTALRGCCHGEPVAGGIHRDYHEAARVIAEAVSRTLRLRRVEDEGLDHRKVGSGYGSDEARPAAPDRERIRARDTKPCWRGRTWQPRPCTAIPPVTVAEGFLRCHARSALCRRGSPGVGPGRCAPAPSSYRDSRLRT